MTGKLISNTHTTKTGRSEPKITWFIRKNKCHKHSKKHPQIRRATETTSALMERRRIRKQREIERMSKKTKNEKRRKLKKPSIILDDDSLQ